MRLTYFGYYVLNTKTRTHTSFDLRYVLQSFISNASAELKNSITYHNGDHLYLEPSLLDNQYVFIQTNSNDLVKKINRDDLSVTEVRDLLEDNESLGFASHLYVADRFFGIASTNYAPRATAFVALINKLLRQRFENLYEFKITAITRQATASDVLKCEVTGQLKFSGTKHSKWYNKLSDTFMGGGPGEFDSFEIILKPKKHSRTSNTRATVGLMIEDLAADPEIEKLTVKAREHENDVVTDLYLHGQGAVSDTLNPRSREPIEAQIQGKLEANRSLTERLREQLEDERISESEITSDDFAQFAWPTTLRIL